MARTFRVYDRAPHIPNRCIVTGTTGSSENPLIDLNTQVDYYGMVYLSYSVLVAVADQLGFATPAVANALRTENESMKKRLDRIPAVTERLVNDIRDISINATADLLTDPSLSVLANDEEPKQGDSRANLDYFGDDNPSQPDSAPAGSEGPNSVPTNSSSKRNASTKPRPSGSGN